MYLFVEMNFIRLQYYLVGYYTEKLGYVYKLYMVMVMVNWILIIRNLVVNAYN
jgi:hypothetical protein